MTTVDSATLVAEVAALLLDTGGDADATAGAGKLRQRLRDLRDGLRDPAVRLHLVEHEEPYDGSRSRDVLIRGLGRTVCVGVAGDAVPWPLRAVSRASDQYLLRVDGRYLAVTDAIACLDAMFADRELLRTVAHAAVVAQLLADEPVELDDAQRQAAADAFRRAKGLYTAERTADWLRTRGLSHEQFAALVERNAAFAALRHRTVGHLVDGELSARPDRYARLVFAFAAGEDCGDGDSGDGDCGLAADPAGTVLAALRDGRAAGVRAARAGELPDGLAPLHDLAVGGTAPATVDGHAVLVALLERQPPVPDEATRAAVERDLFARWLDDRLRDSDVEWFWGTTGTTAALGS